MYKPKPMPLKDANRCLESCRSGNYPMVSDSFALLALGEQRDALLLQVDAWRKAVLMFRVSSHSQVQNALDGIEQEVSKATGIPAEKLYEGLFTEKRVEEPPITK